MGSCFSTPEEKEFNLLYEKDASFLKWREQFDVLNLQKKDIFKLHEAFKKVDIFQKGLINVDDLLSHMKVPPTRFTRRIFDIFDERQIGSINFGDFVLTLWNYCTLSKVALGKAIYNSLSNIPPFLSHYFSSTKCLYR